MLLRDVPDNGCTGACIIIDIEAWLTDTETRNSFTESRVTNEESWIANAEGRVTNTESWKAIEDWMP